MALGPWLHAGFGHDDKIVLPLLKSALAFGRATSQAKAFELFPAVSAVDVEALGTLLHRPAVSPAKDNLVANGPVAGFVPILASRRTETAIELSAAPSIDEGVAADEAGDDVVLSGWASSVG
jgi:hypothetical protein